MKLMGLVFSNIYDRALSELTNVRTVASLPFGGRYRQIDFVLSNMSYSGIYNIGIITKYNYRSLMDHLGSCSDWDLNRKNEGVTFLPPFADGSMRVYQGKLEALYSAVHFINNPDYDYVVLCDSVVLCNIDYRPIVRKHIQSGADVTIIGTGELCDKKNKYPLVLKANNRNRVTEMRLDAYPSKDSLVGMGMYIFKREYLVKILEETASKGLVQLERDFLQKMFNANNLKINVYQHDGVVLYNLDVASYYKNSMALLDKNVRERLFKTDHPIYTKIRDEAPTYYVEGSNVEDCLVADGCIMYGSASKSIFFRNVSLAKDARVESSIIMQGSKIGEEAVLKYVILDKDVTVKPGTEIIGTSDHPVIIKKGEVV